MMLKMFLFALLLFPVTAFAAMPVNPSYVSPTGSGTACTDVAPCALSYANASAEAGDVVYLKTGTYSTLTDVGVINPSNSGSAGNVIHFTASPSASPVVAPATYWAIALQGKDYIKISNIDFTGANRFFYIGNGADYNEITGCTFAESGSDYYSTGIITYLTTAGTGCTGSTHNWIHGNTFTKYGYLSGCDDLGTIRIAADPSVACESAPDPSDNNTVEDNVFSYGGHDTFDLGGKYNVLRNNVFHNEEAYYVDPGGCTNSPTSGKFGNRTIITSDYGAGSTQYNLIEGNRAGHAGTPPDDDGAFAIENAAAYSLIRYNYLLGAGAAGYEGKTQQTGYSDYVRFYNNTLYANGLGDADIGAGWKYAAVLECDGATHPGNGVIKNNIFYGNANDSVSYTGTDCRGANTISDNLATDPSFVNTSMTDKTSLTLPNLTLQAGSGAIDGATSLTLANGAGNNTVTLIVDDALYFQDGTWGASISDIQADWIAIGTVGNMVQISSIDYATNTVTLSSAKTWADDAPIWLYKKSDGERVLYGDAPDYGAHEHNARGSGSMTGGQSFSGGTIR